MRKALNKFVVAFALASLLTVFSNVALASSKVSGSLTINGNVSDTLVNGEVAEDGRSVSVGSSVSSGSNSVLISFGKQGAIALSPDSTVSIGGSTDALAFELVKGTITAQSNATAFDVKAPSGTTKLEAGKSVSTSAAAPTVSGAGTWLLWGLVIAGGIGVITFAALKGNDTALGGGTVVTSPTR